MLGIVHFLLCRPKELDSIEVGNFVSLEPLW